MLVEKKKLNLNLYHYFYPVKSPYPGVSPYNFTINSSIYSRKTAFSSFNYTFSDRVVSTF